ncbi:MAG: prevent-host-death protein [Bacteroidota bacterium]
MRAVKPEEAQQRLPELIEEAALGEEVVIARGDGEAFRLTPVLDSEPRPVFGSARGLAEMAGDFDAPKPVSASDVLAL